MKRLVIIGGGISALSLAYFLEKKACASFAITILEKNSHIGGQIQTLKTEQAQYELGPRGFRPTGNGKKTLLLAQELGLHPLCSHPFAKKRFLADSKQLAPLNPWYLLRKNLLSPLLFEWKKKSSSHLDESVASFFSRRFNNHFVQELITPLCHGIFAQIPQELSMQASFPSIWQLEKEYSSLTAAFFFKKKEKKIAALCSFKEGMQALPLAIVKKLHSSLLLNHEVKKIAFDGKEYLLTLTNKTLVADLVVTTDTSFDLPLFPQKKSSLTLVHLLTEQPLSHKGFGFLTTDPKSLPLLGATFDSQTFPEGNYSKLCFILRGILEEQKALSIVEKAANQYLKIHPPFIEFFVTTAKDAIYQYPVHHKQQLQSLEKQLPQGFYLTGAQLYGVGVNECIHRSDLLSDHMIQELKKT